MAIKTETVVTTTVYDDLDEKELPEDTKPTYFGWGGRRYEIYLSEQHQAAFEKAITKYVDAAKDVTTQARTAQGSSSRRTRSSSSSADKEQLAAMRAWAQSNVKLLEENGLKVPGDRGRIAQGVHDLYQSHAG
jgi:hypothetical protein